MRSEEMGCLRGLRMFCCKDIRKSLGETSINFVPQIPVLSVSVTVFWIHVTESMAASAFAL